MTLRKVSAGWMNIAGLAVVLAVATVALLYANNANEAASQGEAVCTRSIKSYASTRRVRQIEKQELGVNSRIRLKTADAFEQLAALTPKAQRGSPGYKKIVELAKAYRVAGNASKLHARQIVIPPPPDCRNV